MADNSSTANTGDASRRRIRLAFLLCAAAWLAFAGSRVVIRSSDDVTNHLESGRRFLARGFIYEGGLNYVYPPFWGMAFAPLSVLPLALAKSVLLGAGVVLFVMLTRALVRTADPTGVTSASARFRIALLAIAATFPFWNRDIADCLINTSLVAIVWLAIEQWRSGRLWRAGAMVGLTIALKCTPALFVLYFLGKRQWRLAAITTLFAAIFSAAPLGWLGWSGHTGYVAQASHWWNVAVRASLERADPSQGVLGVEAYQRGIVYEDTLNNLSLKPALARYLTALPHGHLGRPETGDNPAVAPAPPDPAFVTFLSLAPATAGLIVKFVTLLIVAGTFAMFSWRDTRPGNPSVLWECAAIGVLMVLLSPVTWKHHCIWTLPAFFLLAHNAYTTPTTFRTARFAALVAVTLAAMLLVSPSLLGDRLAALLRSYHVGTASLLALLAVTLMEMRSLNGTTPAVRHDRHHRAA